ncbi:MAG: hypothetical protein RR891_05675 [Clostridium sp.]|uniref:SHOCT-like domain-containing protein n=1 Tax=Clostridium sp. TaxID=1506 RepID=UPI0030553188
MDDKLRILKMVEEGKLTGEQASKLLETLGNNGDEKSKVMDDSDFFNIPKSKNGIRMLYVRVKSHDGDNVKVTIPLEIVKIMATSGTTVIGNIDKYNIQMDMILEAIDNGIIGPIVEVDTEDGDKVLVEIA